MPSKPTPAAKTSPSLSRSQGRLMENAAKKAVAANYHHGDLRNALIIAAAELIEESGS